jgi:asparaginyl-tRNA synthetase
MRRGARSFATAAGGSSSRRSVLWYRSEAPLGCAAHVSGWVRSVRRQKGVSFVEVGDGSCARPLQVVLGDDSVVHGSGGESRAALTTGASVVVRGRVVESPHPAQRVEVSADTVTVIGQCDSATYPLQKKVCVCASKESLL